MTKLVFIYGETLEEENMLDPKKLEEIAKNISDAIPPGLKSMADDVESKVKQSLQSQLSKLDFVTREEFDIQSQVLIRTREKLEALEARITALENDESAQ